MRKAALLVITFLAVAFCLAGPARASGQKVDPFTASFTTIDQDHDGRILVAEIVAVYPQGGKELHRLADLDRDGKVSKEEWEAWQKKYGKQKPAFTAVRFVELDTDADGNVVANEFFAVFGPEAHKAFEQADQNKDGKLSEKEWQSFRRKAGVK